MRLLLGTVPLVGALLIAASPVQAVNTQEELEKAYDSLESAYLLCAASGILMGTLSFFRVL